MISSERLLSTGLLLALLLSGCPSSDPDDAPGENAGGAGGSTGTPTGKGAVGGPCASSEDCQQGECRTFLEYVPLSTAGGTFGWCSPSCSSSDDCPGGFRCTQAGSQQICLPRCKDHPDCGIYSGAWKCAEAGTDRVCADPKGPRGELKFSTKVVVKAISFGIPGSASVNYRLVPGIPVALFLDLENKGSSGPVDTSGMILKSDSEWLQVSKEINGYTVLALPGTPINTPLQLTAVVPDPIGVGTVEVPLFLRSWKPSLLLSPEMATPLPGGAKGLGVMGRISGLGNGWSLKTSGIGSPETAGAAFDMGDPWMTERPLEGSLGQFTPSFGGSVGDILGAEITDPSGVTWTGTLDVVPPLEGLVFPPDIVPREALAGGKSAETYFRLRYQPSKTPESGLPITVEVDQPWMKVSPTSAKIWNGETAFTVTVTEPAEPGSCRGWVKILYGSPNGRFSRLPVIVFPNQLTGFRRSEGKPAIPRISPSVTAGVRRGADLTPLSLAGRGRSQSAARDDGLNSHRALLFPFSLSSPRCPPGRGGSGG